MYRLWSHKTRLINLNLVVNYFKVKYIVREHTKHLKTALESMYKMTADWEDKLYIGITLK